MTFNASGCGQVGAAGLSGARRVAVSPDGKNVYVAGQGSSAVAVLGRSPANADLALSETGAPPSATTGDSFTYTYKVANHGPAAVAECGAEHRGGCAAVADGHLHLAGELRHRRLPSGPNRAGRRRHDPGSGDGAGRRAPAAPRPSLPPAKSSTPRPPTKRDDRDDDRPAPIRGRPPGGHCTAGIARQRGRSVGQGHGADQAARGAKVHPADDACADPVRQHDRRDQGHGRGRRGQAWRRDDDGVVLRGPVRPHAIEEQVPSLPGWSVATSHTVRGWCASTGRSR